MQSRSVSKRTLRLRNLLVSVLVIAFFVAIIAVYYRMLVNEKRKLIIRDGEMSAWQVESQFNDYLATSIDALKLTAYTLEGMVRDDRSGEEILDYLVGQSTAVINAIFENTMGVYGYINGGYYDGAGWIPEEGFQPKERPWYIQAVANNGEVTLIDPYVDAQSGEVMMSLAKMLEDGESVVSMDIYLDRMQEITENAVKTGETDIELVLDSRSIVIAHSDRGEVGKDYSVEEGTLAAAIVGNMGSSDKSVYEFDYNGVHYIAYQSKILNDWRCFSIKDATKVFRPLLLILHATIVVAAVIVFVLTAFLSSYNKNNQTIEDLTEETKLDKLTGFLNKAGTNDAMPGLCSNETGMLAILDLDSFKLVNDLYGHDMGDSVLSAFANIVRQNTRSEDVLCRIGGDEFVVFCKNVTEGKVVAGLAKRLNTQLVAECKHLMGDDFAIPIGVSVGAVPVPSQGSEYNALFQLADKVLYQVKQNGKHGYAVYDSAQSVGADSADSLNVELARITQILDERNAADSALWLGQDDFTSVYRFMRRTMKHCGVGAAKLLFLVSPAEGVGDEELPEAAERFSSVLNETLSVRDVIYRRKPTQFLVLLPGEQNAEAVAASILDRWQQAENYERYIVSYVADALDAGSTSHSDSGL
ncbi:MAG: GGDEF domain-containing protein [Oscillospiraceae bacterium]|nr:GGDEF domain-containing protein [Oscillospiraceae bacterium]